MESDPLIYIMSEQEIVKNKAAIVKKRLKKQKRVNKQKKVQSCSVHRLEGPDKEDKNDTVVIRKHKQHGKKEATPEKRHNRYKEKAAVL